MVKELKDCAIKNETIEGRIVIVEYYKDCVTVYILFVEVTLGNCIW